MLPDPAFEPEIQRFRAIEDGMTKQRTARGSRASHSFEQGLALHRQGRLGEADRIYNAILATDPHNVDALHLSGVLKSQQGQSVDALRLVAAALKAKPESPDALVSYGLILDVLKRHEEALESFDRALAHRADDAAIHYNRGNALKGLGRYEEALASYDRALAIAPDLAVAHHNRGSTYAALNRNDEALASFDRALALILERAGIDVEDGISLATRECSDRSFEKLNQALAADPNSADALNNRGKVLLRLKRYDEAIASFDWTLVLRPEQADAHCFRGGAFAESDRFVDAFSDFTQALRIRPDFADAHLKRGNALVAMNQIDEALRSFSAALTIEPDNPDAKFNEALVRLCLGDFRQGWRKYESRWERPEWAKDRPSYPRPMWRGEKDIAGKTILLVAEQGLGDTIQFARYAPLIAALGAKVLLGVRPSLTALLATVPGVSQVFVGGETLPEFDLYCPLLSLPLAFETELATIPSTVPYIRPLEDRVARWRERLPQNGRLRVGICWAGTGAHPNNRRRSIPIERFATILSAPGVDFVNLQKDVDEAAAKTLSEHGVNQLGQEFADFADTAAVVAMLDLVISVDTSVAHLAGAMAKAVALLVPFSPDFRWMLDRTDTPWYPTMRLFRQSAIDDWEGPLQRLHRELTGLARRAVISR
jgi:tetratricopeptide (TPR) repeat protein